MKSRLLSVFVLFILSFSVLQAQNISNLSFRQEGTDILITYDITAAKFNQKFNLELYVSTDGGASFTGPLQSVRGAIGTGVISGKGKKIRWAVFEEMPTFGGDIVFDIRAVVTSEGIPKKFYIGYKGSYNSPLGIVAGRTGRVGYYISGRLSPGSLNKVSYQTNGDLLLDYNERGYYRFSGRDNSKWISVTGGIQVQVSRNFHWTAGAGFTRFDLLWEVENYTYPSSFVDTKWAVNNQESFTGPELETGIMYQSNFILISAGLSAKNLNKMDVFWGIAYLF